MAKRKVPDSSVPPRKIRPALTPEAEEQQLISLAVDCVKQRLLDGTASSQETVHFLKLGTTTARLEQERIRQEVELKKAKISALKSAEDVSKLYAEAIAAFRNYSGQGDSSEYEDEYDDYD